MSGLVVRPDTVKAAQKWVAQVHRKLKDVQGAMWCIQLLRDGERVGVAMVGHPARVWNGLALCVLRVAVVEGVQNGCSKLYGACSRSARGMGALSLVTYTHEDEPGTSLRAAGWIDGGLTTGGEHDREGRPRQPSLFPEPKRRWWAPWSQIPGQLPDLKMGGTK